MFKLEDLIRRDIVWLILFQLLATKFQWTLAFLYVQDKIAMSIATEQGKTLHGAKGDLLYGLGNLPCILQFFLSSFFL